MAGADRCMCEHAQCSTPKVITSSTGQSRCCAKDVSEGICEGSWGVLTDGDMVTVEVRDCERKHSQAEGYGRC